MKDSIDKTKRIDEAIVGVNAAARITTDSSHIIKKTKRKSSHKKTKQETSNNDESKLQSTSSSMAGKKKTKKDRNSKKLSKTSSRKKNADSMKSVTESTTEFNGEDSSSAGAAGAEASGEQSKTSTKRTMETSTSRVSFSNHAPNIIESVGDDDGINKSEQDSSSLSSSGREEEDKQRSSNETTPTTVFQRLKQWRQVEPADDALHLNDSIWQRQSKRMARCPCTYLWIAMVISLALSFIALTVGDFSVSAETGGWQSRGTLIADRQTQAMLARYNAKYLFYNGEEAWNDLINTVQPGWDTEDDDDDEGRRRLERRLLQQDKAEEESFLGISHFNILWDEMLPKNSFVQAAINEHDFRKHVQINQHQPPLSRSSRQLPFVMTPELRRRLQDEQMNTNTTSTSSLDLSQCDLSFYDASVMTSDERLWPVWKVNDPTKTALDPDILKDICIAEQNTQRSLQENGLCFGCPNGQCLPPFSVVFYARLIVVDGMNMDCDTLATAWAPYQEKTEELWKSCVETLKDTYDPNNQELPDNCPFGFYPTLVQADYEETMITTYTSSIFATSPEVVDDLYLEVDSYDHGSSAVQGAYDTQYEDFINIYLDESLGRDMALALGSAVVVSAAIMIHTRSPLITGVGLLQIVLSFPLSYFVYKLVAGLDFFPFLNFIGIFVVFALGAGDIFVAIDKWKNARISFPVGTYSTEFIAAKTLPDAANAMFLTTLTTAVAFFATAICPVAPIKMFAIFCGLLILFDYIMNVLLVFPALCIYDKAMVAKAQGRTSNTGFRHKCWMCCVSCTCCGFCGPKSRMHQTDDLEDAVDAHAGVTASRFIHTESRELELAQEEEEEAMVKASWIQRMMLGFYHYLHCLRWPLFVICAIVFGLCVYYTTTLDLPTSSDVRLLDEEHEYEKSFAWRQYLLSQQLEKLSGSSAHVMFGVTPADTGDQNNPASWSQLVLDQSFDASSEESQVYLRNFCDDLFSQDFASPVDNNYTCPIVTFDEWLALQSTADDPDDGYIEYCAGASKIPVPPAMFNSCISHWTTLTGETSILSRNGTVAIIIIPFSSRVRYDSFFDVLDDEWNLIEDWFNMQNADAPDSVNQAYFTSFDFWWYDTNGQMLQTAYSAAGIALGCAAAVILFSSRSIVLTLFSTVTIGYVLTSVTAMLVAIGWTLGFLESICFAILIGVSVDFVIHFSHAYSSKRGNIKRGDRTKYALVKMGPSILATAITTILSAVVMLFTIITFFQKFALILFFTVLQATIGSFIVFLTLVDCIGPSNPTFLADECFACCCKRKQSNDQNDSSEQESVGDGKNSLLSRTKLMFKDLNLKIHNSK